MGGSSSRPVKGTDFVRSLEKKRLSADIAYGDMPHLSKGKVKHASWINELFDEDCFGPCNKLLGLYDEYAVLKAIQYYGINEAMMNKGIGSLEVKIDLSDTFVHKLSIYGQHVLSADNVPCEECELAVSGGEGKENMHISDEHMLKHKKGMSNISLTTIENTTKNEGFSSEEPEKGLLFQLFMRKIQSFDTLKQTDINKVYGSDARIVHKVLEWRDLDLLQIEWLLLQNPWASMESGQLFPGQKFPGLGIGPIVLKLFREMTSHQKRDGMVNVPMYFHNGLLFSRFFMFLNPKFEGIFLTLVADLKDDLRTYGLPAVSNAILQGRLIFKPEAKRVVWVAEEQFFPSSLRMRNYFNSEDYVSLCNAYTVVEKHESDGDFSAEEILSISPNNIQSGAMKLFRKKKSSKYLEEPVPIRLEGRMPNGAGLFEIDWEGTLPSNDEMESAIKLRDVDPRSYK